MKIAVMQPYFFPYIAYFQLIHAVDAFVFYDDVQYIKGGWINRNYILSQGEKRRITLHLKGASPNRLINQIEVGNNRLKILKTISQSYAKAPYFHAIYPLIERIFKQKENNLAAFIEFSIRQVCKYLKIHSQWHVSSDLQKDASLRGQDKVLSICKELGASQYINMPGGRNLYDRERFEKEGIKLSFLEPKKTQYQQFGQEFMSNLSIIDVMMFNSLEQCQGLLKEYSLA